MKHHGRTHKAILETIRVCKDKNILKEYLESREKEVVNIMLAQMDEKEMLLEYIECEKYEAAKETKKETEKRTALHMLKAGKISIQEIPQFFPTLSKEDMKELQEAMPKVV